MEPGRKQDIDDKKVDDLVRGPWDTIAVYHLSDTQAKSILSHNDISAQKGWLPAHYAFPPHTHDEPQLLLIKRGRLTHMHDGMNYVQGENDLLVVPAKLKHTAIIGSEELEFWLLLKK